MRKIFVKVLMSQGNLEEIKAFDTDTEPTIPSSEQPDEEWTNGSKIFEVDLEEEKTWDVVVTQKNVFQVDAVDENEAKRQAEFDCIWDERCGDYKYEIKVKETSDG